MTDRAAEQKIRAARGKAAFCRRYFDSALYAHILVESPTCPTLSVDQHRRLYYNPKFVHALTIPQLATCLLHEIGPSLRWAAADVRRNERNDGGGGGGYQQGGGRPAPQRPAPAAQPAAEYYPEEEPF